MSYRESIQFSFEGLPFLLASKSHALLLVLSILFAQHLFGLNCLISLGFRFNHDCLILTAFLQDSNLAMTIYLTRIQI